MSYQDDDVSYDNPGSFPREYGYYYGDPESSSKKQKPKIILMGLRRSGKSSISKVVFHKMAPNETLFLESTNKLVKDDINNSTFVQFQIWDFPGQVDFFDSSFDVDMIFTGCQALIFVIDAQDDYNEALNKLNLTVTKAYKVNPDIIFEVFIHKVDGLGDEFKMESQRDIHQRAVDDLLDSNNEQIQLSFHLTSIYDHSIFEAFSKVVQKLIPQLATLENLLNILNTVRVEVPAHSSNLSRREWWDGTLPAALEDGVLVGGFLPPPPRPAFLDGRASSDGLTTCDLCTWALRQANIYTLDATLEIQDEIGWVLTLVIVSIVSAVIGAIIMIVVLQCKRLKSNDRREQQQNRSPALRPPINIPDDKSIATIPVTSPSTLTSTTGVWSWLSRRSSTGPSQLDNPLTSATENHYTHMAENYNSGEEAFYTELDNDSNPTYHESGPAYQRTSSPVYESTPAYQNSAYTDPDFQVSSAPSSAYYSDLSITAVPDRAYEVVGLATMPTWDNSCGDSDIRRIPDVKLSSISENVLTDYV